MAKKNTSVSLESEKWDALQVEADKRHISRNELIGVMADALLSNQPIISEVIDLDKEIKQKKLEVETEKHRKLKNDNDHYEKHGYYPTKPARFVTEVVEQKKPMPPIQNEWKGSSYGSEETDIPKYHENISNLGKSKIVKHFCQVKKSELEFDIYKRVQCPYCGATL